MSVPRSSLALAALATVAIPGLNPVACRTLDTTTDFDVALIVDDEDRHWVIKAPRSAISGAALEAEVALLETFASGDFDLPFATPDPQGLASLPEGGRAMMFPQIAGQPLNPTRVGAIAAQVAEAIAAIHALPTGIIDDAGMPVFSAEEFRQRRLTELDEAAATGHVPSSLLSRWEMACEDVRLWRFVPTVVHGDLTSAHIFIDDVAVSGVMEWASAHVGDPALDLAPLIAEAPEHAVDLLLDAYTEARNVDDEFLLARVVLASELALLPWLMHGIRTENADITSDAISMLTELASITEGSPPIAEIGLELEPEEEYADEGDSGEDTPDFLTDPGPLTQEIYLDEIEAEEAAAELKKLQESEEDAGEEVEPDDESDEPVRSSAAPGSGAIKLTEGEDDDIDGEDDMPTVEIPRSEL